jgi:hypothetical protein
MSRTLSGNLTGKAAQTEMTEFRARLQEPSDKLTHDQFMDVCWALSDIMRMDAYLEWVEAQPEEGFTDLLCKTLVDYMTEDEPHPIEEAVAIERVIDAQLPYTRVFNPYLSGSVRYCSELDERKAQADAICEEYEAAHIDGCGTDSDLYDVARGG